MTDYGLVLRERFADCSWMVKGDHTDFGNVVWMDLSAAPSQADLDALWPEVLAERQEANEAQKQARASAVAKLQALGLTEEEAAALVGGF
jgi:hypothetical protein